MPILTKEKLTELRKELDARYVILNDALRPRELKNNSESTKISYWISFEKMCATTANDLHLRLAVEDFKNILAEIKKLK